MLKTAIVLVGLCAVGLATPNIGFGSILNMQPKIVGGEDAGIGEFPYQASLQLRGGLSQGHFCGGSILSENVILTAGHCITEVNVPIFAHVEVHVGLNNLANEGANVQTSKIAKTTVHPDYQGGVNPNDIAIHILETPLTFNEFVSAIALPAADEIPSGTAVLSGWGSTSTSSFPIYPDKLQKADLPLITYDECENAWGVGQSPLAPTNVCSGPLSGGLGACSGDSGGPLAVNGAVVGIVSWGQIPCGGRNAPSVYTRTSAFIPFINEQLALAKTYLK